MLAVYLLRNHVDISNMFESIVLVRAQSASKLSNNIVVSSGNSLYYPD